MEVERSSIDLKEAVVVAVEREEGRLEVEEGLASRKAREGRES